MATWNSPQPLKVTQTRQKDAMLNGKAAKVREFAGFTKITLGDQVPDELLTVDFIGNTIDQLANLTAQDKAKLDEWKRRNPRVAYKWDHLERSPHFWKMIFPDRPSSILHTE